MISSHLLSGKSATLLMNCIPFISFKITCIIDEDIDSAKHFDGFLNQKFTIQGLSKVCINVMGLDVGVISLKMLLDFFKVFLCGKTIEDDIEVSFSEGVGDTKSDSA